MRHLISVFILVSLAWSANNETDLAGYRAFYRSHGGTYQNYTWAGVATTCTIDVSGPGCFVVRAFDTSGNESGNSDEVCTYSWADHDRDGDVDAVDLAAFVKEYGN